MRGILTRVLWAFCLTAGTVRGDFWTNTAGHAIEAELIRVDGKMAVLELVDKTRMEMPLSGLSVESRARAEAEAGVVKIPVPARGEYDHCVRTLRRLSQLREAKRLAEEDYSARRRTAIARLKEACLRLKTDDKLTPETLEQILALASTN